MKKTVAAVLIALLSFGFASCAPAGNSSGGSDIPASSFISGPNNTPSVVPEINSTDPFNRIFVADAKVYRGTVLSVTVENDGSMVLELSKAAGKNYGLATAQFKTNGDTRYNSETGKFLVGSFLEIAYGGDEKTDQPILAVAVNFLEISEKMVNHNGEVTSINIDPTDKTKGSVTIINENTAQEHVFTFDSSTQFYVAIDQVKVGEKLNILSLSIVTASLPPQSAAVEISLSAATTGSPSQPATV